VSEAGQARNTNGIALTDFVLTELNIGLQFIALARDSYLRNLDSDGHRQMAAAIHARQTAKDSLPQVDSTETQRTMIEQRMVELGTAISDLENLFPRSAAASSDA
jgi:hypothetical protein